MKKFVAMLLAVLMVLGLVACGAKEATPEAAPAAPEKSEVGNQEAPEIEAKTEEELKEEASAEKDYSGRKLSLMMSIGGGGNWWQPVADRMMELYPGLEVEVIFDSTAADMFRTQYLAGEAPDAFMINTGSIPNYESIEQGIVQPIDDMLALPTMDGTSTLGEILDLDVFTNGAKDGHYYVMHEFQYLDGFWYDAKFFRDNNLTIPTDWESFYTLLKTLKAACPESYPLVIWGLDYSLTGFQKFAQQFGVDYIAKGFPSGEDGLYYDPVSTEEMRLMLTRLRQLIVEELLHPDCLNGELGGQWRNALKEGSSFIAHYPVISLQALEDAGRKTNPDFSLSCFQNIPMVDSALPFTTRIPSVEGYYWTVIHDAEDIDLAVRYLDWLYSEEGIEALSWGKEGVTFEVDEAGNKHYTDTVLQDSRLKALFASERLSGYIDQEAVLVNYSEKNIQLLLETVTSAEAGGFQTPLPLEHFVPELRKAFNRYFSGYMWIRQKYIENFLTGELDIRNDAHWQEMKDALETNGVSQLLEAYNTACQANNRE